MDAKGIIPLKYGTLAWVEIHDGDFRETYYEPNGDALYDICDRNNLPFAHTMKMIDDTVRGGAHGILINIPEYKKGLLENSIVHLYYQNYLGAICELEKKEEWVTFDHTATGRICPACQEKIGKSIV